MNAAATRARLDDLLKRLADAGLRYEHARAEDYYERMGPDHTSSRIAAELGALEDVALVSCFATLLSESSGPFVVSGIFQSLARLGERAIPDLLDGYARTSSFDVAAGLIVAGHRFLEPLAPEVAVSGLGAALRRNQGPLPTNELARVRFEHLVPLLPIRKHSRDARFSLLALLEAQASADAIPALQEALDTEEDAQLRGRVLAVLAACGWDESLSVALDRLAHGARAEQIGALAALLQTDRQRVLDALATRPTVWRGLVVLSRTWVAAAEFLERAGDPAVGPVAEELASDDDQVRADAIAILGRIGTPRAADQLLAYLSTQPVSEGAWLSALSTLGSLGDQRALETARAHADDLSDRIRVRSLFARAALGDVTALPRVVSEAAQMPARGVMLLRALLYRKQTVVRDAEVTRAVAEALLAAPDALDGILTEVGPMSYDVLTPLGGRIVPFVLAALERSPRQTLAGLLNKLGDPSACEPLRSVGARVRAEGDVRLADYCVECADALAKRR